MENRQTIYLHILIALLMAVLLYVGLRPLTELTDWILIMDVAIAGIVLSGLLILLKNVVQYGHFSSQPIPQRFINYSALGVLFVVCWLGVEFLVMYISISENDWTILSKTVPIRLVIAFFAYGISIMFFARAFDNEEETRLIEDTATKEDIAETADDTLKHDNEVEIIERIAVKNGQKIEVVPVSEIIHLQAEGDYVMIHSTKGKFLKEQTMKSLECSLPADKFVRVHRSNIINVDFIAQIELYDKQTQLLKLKNGAQVRASLTGYKLLKKTLGL
ncbi:MAG: LytR/AlgR family response regulator transcription factor [Dysgonomonas sp.]